MLKFSNLIKANSMGLVAKSFAPIMNLSKMGAFNFGKKQRTKIRKADYEREMLKLQCDLNNMQQWATETGARIAVVFEGRDTAGKGGVIKRITQQLSPRFCKIAALPAPTDREKSQWYFQKYVSHLPAGGEMVLFDRSWYNRAGVEPVMGFCSDDQYRAFLRDAPAFERMLTRDGIILLKYWFSVSPDVQIQRLKARLDTPVKRWKLSPMDLQSLDKWVEYSKVKDRMLVYTDTKMNPWYDVPSDVKKHARLNCIHHLLGKIPYDKTLEPEPIDWPETLDRDTEGGYVRIPKDEIEFVPEFHQHFM